MVAASWQRQFASRRTSWLLDGHPGADAEKIIEQWRDAEQSKQRPPSANSRHRLPSTASLQKGPSSETAQRVLAGELSPRTALPFLHSVKHKLEVEKEAQRVAKDLRHSFIKEKIHRGALGTSMQ